MQGTIRKVQLMWGSTTLAFQMPWRKAMQRGRVVSWRTSGCALYQEVSRGSHQSKQIVELFQAFPWHFYVTIRHFFRCIVELPCVDAWSDGRRRVGGDRGFRWSKWPEQTRQLLDIKQQSGRWLQEPLSGLWTSICRSWSETLSTWLATVELSNPTFLFYSFPGSF